MKKITAVLLALSLVFAFPMFAFADGTTTLTTTVPAATYTLTIPSDTTVTYGVNEVDIKSLDAEATSGFAVGKNVKVTISYTPFSCDGVSTTIPYTVGGYITFTSSGTTDASSYGGLSSGSSLIFKCVDTNKLLPTNSSGATHTDVTSVSYSKNYKDYYFNLKFSNTDWGKALAGDYTATMTFTSEVVAAE